MEGERIDLEVRRHRSLLFSCHEFQKDEEGLRVRFEIDPDGHVPLARAETPSAYGTCQENRFRHMEFRGTETRGFVLGEWVDALR